MGQPRGARAAQALSLSAPRPATLSSPAILPQLSGSTWTQVPRGPAFTERLSQGSEGLTDQHPLYEGTHTAGEQEAGTPVGGLGRETRPDQLSCKGHCQGHPCMWEAF